jgi:GNAT superfamily N-acetyltransferase
MVPIHIRTALPDEPGLSDLAVTMHLESERRHLTWAPDEFAQEVVYHATQPSTHCGFVAESAGRAVGFIGGCVKRFDFSTQSRLCSTFIYVSPDFRGSTAFPKLLRAFESWAVSHAVPYVEIGMSGGVNTKRLQLMFAKIGYQWIGNVLAYRAQLYAPNAMPTSLNSRHVPAAKASHWEAAFRAAHGRSALAAVPFDAVSYRNTFEALATSRSARIYELLEGDRVIGVYGMRLQKITMCKAIALKCVFTLGSKDQPASKPDLLRAVCEKLPEYQAACGAQELFWLTSGTHNPRATERALRSVGFHSLGGTFIKQTHACPERGRR